VLSSWIVERDRLGSVSRLLTGLAMGSMIKDKRAGEQLLRRSDLDWTIAYASMLSDGPAGGSVVVLPEGSTRSMSQRISRADAAAWLIEAAAGGQPSHRSVGITAEEAVEHVCGGRADAGSDLLGGRRQFACHRRGRCG